MRLLRWSSGVAWRYTKHGAVHEVLERVTPTVGSPGAGEVAVRFLAAGVTPWDVADVQGWTGAAIGTSGAFAGSSGVAEVLSVGSGVKGFAPGDWVVPARARIGTWRSGGVVVKEDDVIALPSGSKDVPVEHAALATMATCAASRLLDGFVALTKGDVIVQSGAATPIGQAVIQIAAERGLRTISFVEHTDRYAQTVERLKALGGTIVVSQRFASNSAMREAAADLPAPKLAFDAAGEPSSTEMARMLAPRGVMVTYAGTFGRAVSVPSSALIQKEVTIRGFSMDRWLQEAPANEKKELVSRVADLMKRGVVTPYVKRMDFGSLSDAISESLSPSNDRGIVVVMSP